MIFPFKDVEGKRRAGKKCTEMIINKPNIEKNGLFRQEFRTSSLVIEVGWLCCDSGVMSIGHDITSAQAAR